MPHFPMFVDLRNKPILIVGGGGVALRKLRKLLPYGGITRVVAPNILPEIASLTAVEERPFRADDLNPRPALVIAATDDEVINREVARLCKNQGIPVNVADSPEDCTFLFPALVQRGEFSAGLSTGGASPTAAVHFKEALEALVPDDLEEILDWLAAQRAALKQQIPDQTVRAGIFRRLFDDAMSQGRPLSEDEAARCMDAPLGRVDLVGAGCGKADLITVRGLRLLQQCQAVVYDDLIDPALLDTAPEGARRIYMGKRRGAHSASQEEINQTLIDLARTGLRVVRLKGGDPYLFGRGGEEMLALKAAGIPCTEVPGIPSPIGIPAEAGIPVTHRGLSRGLHIVTAHTKDGVTKELSRLAALDGTLLFLMGLAQAEEIADGLLAAGRAGETPTAVISGGNSPNPACVRTTLAELPQAAKKVQPPAVILVGEVAALELE